jgi:feruloyl esterase
MRILVGGLTAVLLATAIHDDTLRAATSCESLSALTLPDATITLAQTVPAGGFTPPGPGGTAQAFAKLPAFCRIAATLKPSSDSDIKIEVWLPVSGWNGNFQAVGNGGWAGSISYPAMAAALGRGYATSSTDTGHTGGSASFALGHPEKLIDYAYRSEHEMTVKAKALISAYYGRAPQFSYWNGCSAGGKQGLKEAQRFPADYDGIIAGAPASNWTGRAAQAMWIAQAVRKEPASFIPAEKFPIIHNAVLAACDAHDGVKDGVLEDPTRCKFDPKTLECRNAEELGCLTAPQVEAVRKIYAPARNARTNQTIFPGHEPGSELGWTTMAGQRPFVSSVEHFQYVVFQDPNWDYRTFNFDTDWVKTEKVDAGTINALDPNLKPYFDRGGKLIQYHGWGDPQISPGSSVDYYKSVLSAMGGASRVADSYRLFMVPGMAHCGGGEGPNAFDMVTALEQWVEKGKAPDSIVASRVRDGKVERTRPLCPYPQVAEYKGSGSTNEAANFVCKAP